MVARNSLWVSMLFGAGCFAVGAALGLSWPSANTIQLGAAAAPPPASPPASLPSFADVVQQVAGAVVTVRAVHDGEPIPSATPAPAAHVLALEQAGTRERTGSGFLVQAQGLVITSRHVVLAARSVDVHVPAFGRFPAELVGEDRAADVALLRLVHAPSNLPTLALAKDDALRAGDWIVAVGNPFGYAQSVTAGVVSFVGRHLRHSDLAVTTDFLQISAPVNPGNSGCPVVDLRGRVVGLMTQAPLQAQGISFAVPSRTVSWTLAEMLGRPDGRVRRGFLGIEFATAVAASSEGAGAVIVNVLEGEAAQRAGVHVGDVVMGIDGAPVRDAEALHERIVCSRPGTEVALHVVRHGRALDPIVAVLGEAAPAANDLPN